MSEHPPRNGAEREPENQEGGPLPEQAPVTGGAASPEVTKGLVQRMREKFGGKTSQGANDSHGHVANDSHGHAEHAHAHGHPGSFLGLWGFLIAKAFKATISGASSGGGHSAPAKKADSHGGGGGGHH